jgi:TRAP-type C4-dicarboxylate transport system substrate-binding protein
MVKDWEQARKNYSRGAPLRETISKLYAKQGIHVLAAWPVYFGGISLNTEPVGPGDPDTKKGIKVRVPPMKSFKLLADSIGYMGTPIPFSDAFTAVQTGVVDGVIGSGAEGYYASFRDVTKYYIPANTHFEVWYLIINDRLYSGLDADMKQKLDKAAAQFEDNRWETAKADQTANEKKLAEFGAEIVDLTPEQIAAYAETARQEVWPEILEDVGKDWGQKVLDQVIK